MPTPIGHTLAGLAVYAVGARADSGAVFTRKNIGWAVLCVVASNAPDLDFIHWGEHGLEITSRFHHGFTHSVGFAFIFASLVSLWAWMRGFEAPAKVFVLTVSCSALHSFMDLFGTDQYWINGIGLPILWPFSDNYYIALIMPGVSRSNPFSEQSLTAIGIELALYGSLALIAARLKSARI